MQCYISTFHLPPLYETHQLSINISLNAANLNVINISSPEFRIWQQLEDHWNGIQLHHLVSIPSVPIGQVYKHMTSSISPVTPFVSTDESIDDTASLWTLFLSYRNLHNNYRITDASRIRDIPLLPFLVLSCQISTLTFTIRLYAVYYCG